VAWDGAEVYRAVVRFQLDWRVRSIGSTQTPRRFLDYIVDDESLYERHRYDLISPLGWGVPDEDERASQRLLGREAPDVEGRVAIYVCPECGDVHCGALTVIIGREGDEIVWSDPAYSTYDVLDESWLHRPARDVETLRFTAAHYQRVIAERPRPAAT